MSSTSRAGRSSNQASTEPTSLIVADGNRFKYVPNFINYNIENFRVSEHGTLQDIIENQTLQATLEDADPERGALL